MNENLHRDTASSVYSDFDVNTKSFPIPVYIENTAVIVLICVSRKSFTVNCVFYQRFSPTNINRLGEDDNLILVNIM